MTQATHIFPASLGLDMLRPLLGHGEPMRRDFGIAGAAADNGAPAIRQRDVAALPFCVLTEFSAAADQNAERILLVAPLSGHFAAITREMVLGLIPGRRVLVTDWLNARHVPAEAGTFGFDDNIAAVIEGLRRLGPGAHLVALCQGAVPALAATAILAQHEPALSPHSLTLIGGPVDPLANPTRVVELLRQRPLAALEATALETVEAPLPGAGRRVYPGLYQLSALMTYLYRHCGAGGELVQKVFADDGLDPARYPFFTMFTALMDLPADYFLENIQRVFQERQPWTGQLRWRGQRIDFRAIRDTALMTVEGERDDIAAPGQTGAAHRLCPNVPSGKRARLVLGGTGHFSLFYGRSWREKVLPAIDAFHHASSPASAGTPWCDWEAGARRAAG